MNPLLKLVFGALLVATASVGVAGNSGGGGNIDPNSPASDQGIHWATVGAKFAFKIYLRELTQNCSRKAPPGTQLSFASQGQEQMYKYYCDPKQEDANLTLQKTKVEIRTGGACYYRNDPTPEDGSADASTMTICLSDFRFKNKKINVGEVDKKAVALFAHEFAHIRGLTHSPEDEVIGKSISDQVERELTTFNLWRLSLLVEKIVYSAQTWQDVGLDPIVPAKYNSNPAAHLTAEDFLYICTTANEKKGILKLGIIEPSTEVLTSVDSDTLGLRLLPDATIAKAHAAYDILENALNACVGTKYSKMDDYGLNFKNKSALSAYDYETAVRSEAFDQPILRNTQLPFMKSGDRAGLYHELERAQKMFQSLYQDVQNDLFSSACIVSRVEGEPLDCSK
jgi:hypothetical protein